MALAIKYGGTSSATANASVYNSSSIPCATGDLLVVFVAASGTVQRPGVVSCSSQTGAASSFTLVTSAPVSTVHSFYAYIANDFCIASSATASSWVTFDCTGDAATGAIITVACVSGMSKKGMGAVKQYGISSEQAASTRPTITFSSATYATSAVFGGVATISSVTKLSPPGGWTEYSDTGYATPIYGLEFAGNVGSVSTLIGWGSSTSSRNSVIALEIWADAPDPMPFMAAFAEHQSLY